MLQTIRGLSTPLLLSLTLVCFGDFGLAAQEEDLQLVISKGSYRVGEDKLKVEAFLKNNGSEPLVVVIPQPPHFDIYHIINDIQYVGELRKPYQFMLTAGTDCTSDIQPTYEQQETTLLSLGRFAVVTLAAGARSSTYKMEFRTGAVFCDSVDYELQFKYEPAYQQMTTEGRAFLEEKARAYESLILENKLYLEGVGRPVETFKATNSRIHFLLDCDSLLGEIAALSVVSNLFRLEKQ